MFNGNAGETVTITSITTNTFSYKTATQLPPVTDVSSATATGPSTTATATFDNSAALYPVGPTAVQVKITGADQPGYNGVFTINDISDSSNAATFSYNVGSALPDATGTLKLNKGYSVSVTPALANGSYVITGAAPSGFNGSYALTGSTYTTFNDLTSLTATTPGSASSAGAYGTTAVVTYANHGLVVGDTIVVSGVLPDDPDGAGLLVGTDPYEGTFTVTDVPDSDTFEYTLTTPPDADVTTLPNIKLGTVLTTALAVKTAHGYADGDTVTIAGAVDSNTLDTDGDSIPDGCDTLSNEDFVVYIHQLTPANDGGLALGQAVIANTRRGAYVS